MSRPKFVVQIGFPKTSTTTLQVNVLGKLHQQNRINFLGNYYLTGLKDVEVTDKLLRKCIFQDGTDFDLHRRLSAGGNYLGGLLEQDRVNVWSNENMTCPDMRQIDLMELPKRVKQAFGDADVDYKIVVTLREQVSLIQSYHANLFEEYYFEDVRKGDVNKFVDYIYSDEGREVLETFDFSNVLKVWEDEFGAENVIVNLFEDAKNDLPRFLGVWADLLSVEAGELADLFTQKKGQRVRAKAGAQYTSDISVGRIIRKKYDLDTRPAMWPPSPRKLAWLFWKIVNKLFWRRLNRSAKKRVLLGEMTADNKARIKSHYSLSNQSVADKWALDKSRMKDAHYFD